MLKRLVLLYSKNESSFSSRKTLATLHIRVALFPHERVVPMTIDLVLLENN
jgi:hypothetical protein